MDVVDVKEGQKLVVWRSSLDGPEKALFLWSRPPGLLAFDFIKPGRPGGLPGSLPYLADALVFFDFAAADVEDPAQRNREGGAGKRGPGFRPA